MPERQTVKIKLRGVVIFLIISGKFCAVYVDFAAEFSYTWTNFAY